MYKTYGYLKIVFSLGLATCALIGWHQVRYIPHAWSGPVLVDPFFVAVTAIAAAALSIKYETAGSVPLVTSIIVFSDYEATFSFVNLARGSIAFYKSGSYYQQPSRVLYGINMAITVLLFVSSTATAIMNGFQLNDYKTTEIKDPNYPFPPRRRAQVSVLMLLNAAAMHTIGFVLLSSFPDYYSMPLNYQAAMLQVAGEIGILSYVTNQRSVVTWFKLSSILSAVSAIASGFSFVHDRLYLTTGTNFWETSGKLLIALMILHVITTVVALGLSLHATLEAEVVNDDDTVKASTSNSATSCIGSGSMIFASIQFGCAIAICPMFPSAFYSFLSFVVASFLLALGIVASLSRKGMCESVRMGLFSFTVMTIAAVCINVIDLTVIYIDINPEAIGIRTPDLVILIIQLITAVLFLFFGARAAEYNPVTYVSRERSGTEV